MKISLWAVGKTKHHYAQEGIHFYMKRIKPFCRLEYLELPQQKNSKVEIGKKKEAEDILKRLKDNDYLILLDDKGESRSSLAFSEAISGILDNPTFARAVFLIGGAYGFHENIYNRAQERWSLSALTFPHDLVRVIFLEQLYRGFTILHNKNYHHE